jgi:integral membrane protein (TIGR01906 family)
MGTSEANLSTALSSLVRIVVILAVPILLIASPLYLYVSSGFVSFQYDRWYVETSSRFEREEREALSDVLIGFLRHRATEADMATLRTRDGALAMRPEEVQHIVDVGRVMDGFFVAQWVALGLLTAAVALAAASRRWRELAQGLTLGVWITMGLMATVLLGAMVNFDAFFTLFHKLFFTGDSWLFYVEDMLIQLYPIGFWVGAVTLMVLTIVAGAGLTLVVARRVGRTGSAG